MSSFKVAKSIVQQWLVTSFGQDASSDFDINQDDAMAGVSKTRILKDIEILDEQDIDVAWKKVALKIKDVDGKDIPRIRSKNFTWFRYAASIALICALVLVYRYILQNEAVSVDKTKVVNNAITLNANGSTFEVLGQDDFEFADSMGRTVAKAQNGQLVYSSAENGAVAVQHLLKVPFGKQATLLFSDGTKVYCDAGTEISYPSYFEAGKTREVTLKGQAYFDVAKQGFDQFIVHTDAISVTVLGTQFNVSTLPENKSIEVVLVEGMVKVGTAQKTGSGRSKLLLPNQRLAYHKQLKSMQVTQVNTYYHTAWVSGRLLFKDATFKTILKTLERKFNVSIDNQNTALNKKRYRAKFDGEGLEEILDAFKESESFEYYRTGNQIILE